jgi:UDP-N-acetylmuramate dehydrogenase
MKNIRIYKNYPIAKLTTFKIGGKAQFYCMPENIDDVRAAFIFAKNNNLNTFVLGGGANLLISDNGIKGLVISTRKLDFFYRNENEVFVGAGMLIDKLNRKLIDLELSGMEFSGGLPGSIGGAVFMNARSYGMEFSNIVDSVTILDDELNEKKLCKNDIDYSYKNSLFMKKEGFFIIGTTLKLNKGNKSEIKALYKKNYNDRIQKGQFDFPSAGCIFKNDYSINIPSGKIIEEAGLKGKKIGGAEVSMKHGNFIINKKNAKAEDVLKLIEYVEQKVYEEKGIRLEREVRVVGF